MLHDAGTCTEEKLGRNWAVGNIETFVLCSEALNRRERLQVSGVNEADPLSGLLKTAGPNPTTGRKGTLPECFLSGQEHY